MLPVKKRGSQLESSSSTDRPNVKAGRLGRPHGLKGYLGLYADPDDLGYFDPKSVVFIEGRPFVVRAVRRADRGYHVAFEDVNNRAAAEIIRNRDIFVAERRTLSDSEFWPDHLVGLAVRPTGGQVVALIHGAAQDRLVIERDGVKFELPFVQALVPVVDVDGGYIEIVEPEGLIESSV